MNDYVRRILNDRAHTSTNRERDDLDYDDGYIDGYADGRRGVKGTGRGSRTRMDRMDHMDGTDRDERVDRRMDRTSSQMYLSKRDIAQWKQMLQNADGTDGPHFTLEKIHRAAENMGIRYDKYTDTELYMAANMLYSDLGEALRSFIPPDKEAHAYVKAAEAFLCDDDGPDGPTKLALYYHCIANYE